LGGKERWIDGRNRDKGGEEAIKEGMNKGGKEKEK
jgi:hypothetical protein